MFYWKTRQLRKWASTAAGSQIKRPGGLTPTQFKEKFDLVYLEAQQQSFSVEVKGKSTLSGVLV